jgi:hypothetical protein
LLLRKNPAVPSVLLIVGNALELVEDVDGGHDDDFLPVAVVHLVYAVVDAVRG